MGSIEAVLLASGVPGLTVGLELISGIAGAVSVIGVSVSRILRKKALKHEAIYRLASAKLNTIHELVTAALSDSIISDSEYKLTVDEVDKYKIMVNEIRFGLHKKEGDLD